MKSGVWIWANEKKRRNGRSTFLTQKGERRTITGSLGVSFIGGLVSHMIPGMTKDKHKGKTVIPAQSTLDIAHIPGCCKLTSINTQASS